MKLAYVDIETTGLDPQVHEVWEIALVVDNNDPEDGSITTYRWTFKPDLHTADPAALRINRFYDRSEERPVESGFARFWHDENEMDTPTVRNALWHLAELTAGAHLVGANVAFDALRIEDLFRANNLAPAWHYHLVDVEVLMLGYLAGRERWPALRKSIKPSGWKSTDLAEQVGIPPRVDAHSALSDALWARDIYVTVMGNDEQRRAAS